MGDINKVYLTWEDVNLLLDNLYQQVKGNVNLVTGIPRGGTLLAILFLIDLILNIQDGQVITILKC